MPIKRKQKRVAGIIVAILTMMINSVVINADEIKNIEKDSIDNIHIYSGVEKAFNPKEAVKVPCNTVLPSAGSGVLTAEDDYRASIVLASDVLGEMEEPEEWYEDIIDPKPEVIDADDTMYVTTRLNVRAEASTDSEVVDKLHITDKINVTGYTEDGSWARIETDDGEEAYVATDYIADSIMAYEADTYNSDWNGGKLSKKGAMSGPVSKETYYNLDMSRVVANMRKLGNNDEVWVRSDGAKMLGDYIMIAANLQKHPRGSLVETSMGTGIVVDTGTFAINNPNQIDIATTW